MAERVPNRQFGTLLKRFRRLAAADVAGAVPPTENRKFLETRGVTRELQPR